MFQLGGHSLLATQVITGVRDSFKIGIELRVLFESPTISELAVKLNALLLGTKADADRDAMAALQAKVEQMSDDEVERALRKLTEGLA